MRWLIIQERIKSKLGKPQMKFYGILVENKFLSPISIGAKYRNSNCFVVYGLPCSSELKNNEVDATQDGFTNMLLDILFLSYKSIFNVIRFCNCL